MRLVDLDPHWIGTHDESGLRDTHLGVSFRCPQPDCEQRLYVPFANPPSGAAPMLAEHLWHREGETFETLTLTPSVDVSKYGHWHGFITAGEIR
jgi:hypothetical protein